MKTLALCLLFLAPPEGAQRQFDNDLFHLIVPFFLAESLDDIASISSKISRLESGKQIKENNFDDVRSLKKEIDEFLSLDQATKLEFIALKKRFLEIYVTKISSNLDRANKYIALLELEKKISRLFANESALSWLYKLTIFDIEGDLPKSQINHTEIRKVINAYEKKYGENSLFLGDLYWYLMRKMTQLGDFNAALTLHEKARNLVGKYTSDRSTRFYCVEILAIKSHVSIGNDERAKNIISQLDVNEVHSMCKHLPYELYLLNSSASILSANKNKLDNAILYQESALIHLEGAVEKGDPALLAEARKMRDLLVKRGDWPSVRKFEKQYKLDPLPKQSGEN